MAGETFLGSLGGRLAGGQPQRCADEVEQRVAANLQQQRLNLSKSMGITMAGASADHRRTCARRCSSTKSWYHGAVPAGRPPTGRVDRCFTGCLGRRKALISSSDQRVGPDSARASDGHFSETQSHCQDKRGVKGEVVAMVPRGWGCVGGWGPSGPR